MKVKADLSSYISNRHISAAIDASAIDIFVLYYFLSLGWTMSFLPQQHFSL